MPGPQLLAFAWFETDNESLSGAMAGERLAASLRAGLDWGARSWQRGQAAFAVARPELRASRRPWKPALLPDGCLVAFNGALDNADELAAQLGLASADPAEVYGAAVARWGDGAEARAIGEYCAVLCDPAGGRIRLSRSPLRAPPLHYWRGPGLLVAASVPRVLIACGASPELDPERAAQSWYNIHSDESRGWYRGTERVPLGAVVQIADRQASTRNLYDPLALPDVVLPRDEDYAEMAAELLDRGVRAALRGARKPGATLSGGLDSPLVAASALRALPVSQTLATFTFRPLPGAGRVVPPGAIGDERPLVEAFAAMHPRIEPHFTDNAGGGFDTRWREIMRLTGIAPLGLTNMYVFHGVWEAARREGCDLLLLAEFGNRTVSAKGEWAFVEFLRRGRWIQLYRALRHHRADPRPLWRKFAALSLVPHLPDPAWRLLKRWRHPHELEAAGSMSPLTPRFVAEHGLDRRLGFNIGRFQPRNRRQAIAYDFANGDWEAAEIHQGFEQLYGIRQRDPMAYRPLAEFCMGLPAEQLVRDGEQRWLAKRLAAPVMPAAQRANRLNGQHDADWAERLVERREELAQELERIAGDPELGTMLRAGELAEALRAWDGRPTADSRVARPLDVLVPRAIMTARFVNLVSGRNAV